MTDGSGGFKQAVAETLAKPVIDEVGKAIEQGVQSVVGGQKLDPAVQQQKRAEEQRKRQEVLRRIEWFKKLEVGHQQFAQQKKQKEQQKLQEEQQKKQNVQQKAFEQQQKQQQVAVATRNAQTRTETKKGVGG